MKKINKIIAGVLLMSALLVSAPVSAQVNSAVGGQNLFRFLFDGSVGSISSFLGSWKLGLGTTTPYAKLGVTATSGQTNPLFQLANSSNSPVFTVDTSGNLTLSGTCTGCGGLSGGTTGQLAYWTGASSLGAVATGTVSVSNSILTATANRSVIGGSLALGFDFSLANVWTGLNSFNANASTTALTVSGQSWLIGTTSIGTTLPTAKLTIKQGTSEYAQISASFDSAIGVASDTALIGGMDFKNFNSAGQVRLIARNDQDNYAVLGAFGSTATGNLFGVARAGNLNLFTTGTAKTLLLGTFGASDLVIGTSDTERIRVLSTGNVGIGSTTPAEKLVVAGGIMGTETAVATSTTIAITMTNSNQQLIQTGTGATTITLGSLMAGQAKRIVVCNPNASAGALTWATSPANKLLWVGGTAPTHTVTANKCDIYTFTVTQATSTVATSPNVFGAYVQNF